MLGSETVQQIDVSRELLDGKPFELRIGKSFVVECWEREIRGMKPGDIRRFRATGTCSFSGFRRSMARLSLGFLSRLSFNERCATDVTMCI